MANPKGRPKLESPNSTVKSIRLSDDLIERIDKFRKEKNLSFAEVIRQAVEEYLNK